MSTNTEIELASNQDCVSRKPWSEVLNRSLKLFTFNLARESGRSMGRVVFFIALAIVALIALTLALDALTGWFSGWFSFWPFGAETPPSETAEPPWWKIWATHEGTPPPAEVEPVPWYCRLNPLC